MASLLRLAYTFVSMFCSRRECDLPYTYSIYIIAIAGAESAIGLGILVAFYRLRGTIGIEYQ